MQLENEKYQTQLDSLRDSKLDGQIKQKKEIDHLRNELRKARIRLDHKILQNSPVLIFRLVIQKVLKHEKHQRKRLKLIINWKSLPLKMNI